MYEAVKCVKPGGVFLLVEGDLEWYAEDMVHLHEPNSNQFPGGSWVVNYFRGAFFLRPVHWGIARQLRL